MVKKYLIPNTTLTNILVNRMNLRRMETRVRWENKYLIPNTALTNILIKYMTLRRMWTRVRWLKDT